MWTGPLSEIASAIEVTILTTIYGRVFTALPSGSNHPITVATVAPELPVANLSANRIGSGSSANRFPPPVVRKLSEVPAEQRHVSSEGRLSAPPPTKTTESDTFHVSRVGGTPSIGVLPQPSSASPRIQVIF
jgi:hypothetical protein